MVRRCWLLFFSSLSLTLPAIADDREALHTIAKGYRRNRDSFQQIDCRFDWIEGQTGDIQAVLSGGSVENSMTMKGHWLVDDGLEYYELLCHDEQNAANPHELSLDSTTPESVPTPNGKPVANVVRCLGEMHLRNPDVSLQTDQTGLVGNLTLNGELPSQGIRVTPFNPDILGSDETSSPDHLYIREGLAGRFPIHFRRETVRGKELWCLEAETRQIMKFGFDPQQGFLLTYATVIRTPGARRSHEMYVTAARQCADNRWFPLRMVIINEPDGTAPWRVKVLEVTDLIVDESRPREEFSLELASGARVDVPSRQSAITLNDAERVYADNLEALDQRARWAKPPTIVPRAESPKSHWPPWIWILLAGGMFPVIKGG
ncbi:hypothetical protein GC163_11855 [bacterium]|nr:hypothetical protein [bacterium]